MTMAKGEAARRAWHLRDSRAAWLYVGAMVALVVALGLRAYAAAPLQVFLLVPLGALLLWGLWYVLPNGRAYALRKHARAERARAREARVRAANLTVDIVVRNLVVGVATGEDVRRAALERARVEEEVAREEEADKT